MTHTLLDSSRVASPAGARLSSVGTPEIASELGYLLEVGGLAHNAFDLDGRRAGYAPSSSSSALASFRSAVVEALGEPVVDFGERPCALRRACRGRRAAARRLVVARNSHDLAFCSRAMSIAVRNDSSTCALLAAPPSTSSSPFRRYSSGSYIRSPVGPTRRERLFKDLKPRDGLLHFEASLDQHRKYGGRGADSQLFAALQPASLQQIANLRQVRVGGVLLHQPPGALADCE